MKRQFLHAVTLLTALTLTVTGCRKKESVESAAKQNAEKQEKKAEEPRSEFHSIDLQTFNLRGHVKEVALYGEGDQYPINTMEFDSDGRLTRMQAYCFEGPVNVGFRYTNRNSFEGEFDVENTDKYVNMVLERDEKNRIVQTPTTAFKYNENNLWAEYTVRGWESETTYKPTSYDQFGNVLTETYNGSGEGTDWNGKNTYIYTNVDSKNNWTERKTCTEETLRDADEIDVEMEPYETITKRTIEYY